MQDLNATMFYKAKFHIAAIEENLDLLWRIVLHIREWMNSKWNTSWEVVPCDCGCWTKLKYGGRIFSTDEKKSVYTPDEICYESPLSKGLIIGRDSSRAQLNFPWDESLANIQCRLDWKEKGIWATELSPNGDSQLNGFLLGDGAYVNPGDTLKLGNGLYRIFWEM